MSDFYTREDCRLCGDKNIKTVLPLSKSPLCDEYLVSIKKQEFFNLNLCYCNECGFVQIDTIVDPEVIYRDYIYVTTSSPGLQRHFKEYASSVSSFLKLDDSKLTIDIGSNDGTLLSYFKQRGHKVLGIEPSIKAAKEANDSGIETLTDFFDSNLAKAIVSDYGKASLITINNLFANIDDLSKFVKDIDIILDDNGILVIESSYLLDMLENMVFDFIYHEHLSYFSILPLVKFFNRFNMHLIHLQRVETKGGSLRYFLAKKDSKWISNESVKELSNIEVKADIGPYIFKKFEHKINDIKKQLTDFLEKNQFTKIVGYGASATSTTLISHFNLQNFISYLVDDNLDKVNTFSPGFHIPVRDISFLKKDRPDLIIIIAWRFEDDILEKLSFYKGVIVVPLPYFKELKK